MSERTPLYDVSAQAGASFREESGWHVPVHYGDAIAEYWHACRDVVLIDRSHHGKIELFGRDAASFLHNLCTNEITHLALGAGCEAFLTNDAALQRIRELRVLVLDQLEL